MVMVKEDVLRAIRKLGANDRHFLAREVREHLGIEPKDPAGRARLYNCIRGLEKFDGVIAQVPGGERKRNRYYRIADKEKLGSRLGGLVADGSEKPGRGPTDRLARIEQDIRSIHLKLDRLIEIWQ
jgi:hypothetical protein